MAWTTPPTFSTGAILTAAQLNILSDDLAYLYGILQSAIHPHRVLDINSQYSANQWWFRYRERYLHYKVTVTGSNGNDAISLAVNGVTRWSDTTPRAQNYVYQGYLDMSGYGLTAGSLYSIVFSFTFPTYNNGVIVNWLRISGSTTL